MRLKSRCSSLGWRRSLLSGRRCTSSTLAACSAVVQVLWRECETMNHDSDHNSADKGHEPVEPRMAPIVISMAALFGTVVLSMLIVALALSYFSHEHANVPRVMVEREKQPAVGPALD